MITNNDYMSLGASQGWQCPVCKNINAPWVQQCPCKGQTQWDTSTTDNETTTIDWAHKYSPTCGDIQLCNQPHTKGKHYKKDINIVY